MDEPRDPPTPQPETSDGDSPLAEVLDNLDGDGFEGQFRAIEGGEIKCLSCRRIFPAGVTPADRVTRLEGESDPADMVMVVPVRCPACRARGTLVLGYGPDSSPEDSDVLVALARSPGEGVTDGPPTPGVSPGFGVHGLGA